MADQALEVLGLGEADEDDLLFGSIEVSVGVICDADLVYNVSYYGCGYSAKG